MYIQQTNKHEKKHFFRLLRKLIHVFGISFWLSETEVYFELKLNFVEIFNGDIWICLCE